MGVNRFNRPVNSRVISQFAPRNLNMIANVLASKQGRYNQEEAKNELLQDEFSKLAGFGESDNTYIKQKGEELNKIAKDFAGRDLSDNRVAKELRTRTRAIANDPTIIRTQQNLKAVQEHSAAVQASREAGNYRPENDPFLQQVQGYEGAQSGQSLRFNGIIKGVNEHDEASKYFDNMPQSGRNTVIALGNKLKEVGWKGINQPMINEAVANSVNSFSQSAAGQQALRRYERLAQTGQIPKYNDGTEVSATDYITGILSTAAQERKGVVTTSIGSNVNPVTGASIQASPVSKGNLGVKFTTPLARRITDADPSVSSGGILEGSGKLSYLDIFDKNKDVSFWDVFTDKSLTDEEKETFLPATILSQVYGISNEEALKSLDKTVAPVIDEFTVKQRKAVDDSFMVKGAGAFKSYTTYDESGKESTGQQVFQELGLLDSDGNFDPEIAKIKGVVVRGPVRTGTGPTANGLYVSTSEGDYIFKTPATTEQQEAFEDSQAKLNGVVKITTGEYAGKYFVRDPKDGTFGVWNPETGQLEH